MDLGGNMGPLSTRELNLAPLAISQRETLNSRKLPALATFHQITVLHNLHSIFSLEPKLQSIFK